MHELDLIRCHAQKKLAEFVQVFLRKIAATVVIVQPLLVGIRQGRLIVHLSTSQSAGDCPEPVAVNVSLDKPGMSEQSGNTAVAVQKRMNPRQPLMRGCSGDQRSWIGVHQWTIEFSEPLEKLFQLFAGRRHVSPNAHFTLTKLA